MKRSVRILAAVTAVILALSAFLITGASAAEYRLADVDMNGQINAEDARLALRVAAKLDTVSALQMKIADIDGDANVNATDARAILRFAAKLDDAPETFISEEGATDEPTSEPTSATEPTSEPTSATEPTSRPDVPEYDIGVDASLAKIEKPKVFYIKAKLSEEGGIPVEIASDGRNTYMHTMGDIAGTGKAVDIGVINRSGILQSGNGLYLINYEKSKYLYMPESIIRIAGMDPDEFSASLGTEQIDLPKITNVSELKPIANGDGTVTVRLHDSQSVYTDYTFASASDNVPVKVTHYVGEKVVSTVNVESYTEDANTVKSYFSAPKGFTEVKLSLLSIDEMMEFMEELGMA